VTVAMLDIDENPYDNGEKLSNFQCKMTLRSSAMAEVRRYSIRAIAD